MISQLPKELIFLILSMSYSYYYDYSLLVGLTCKSFYDILKTINSQHKRKYLKFYISDPIKECLDTNTIFNLLIYSHKFQIERTPLKIPKCTLFLKSDYSVRQFSLWRNCDVVDFALKHKFRECFTYGLDNDLTSKGSIRTMFINATFKLGNIDDVSRLCHKINYRLYSNKCISEACNHGRLDILKYLHNLSIRCDNVHYITVAIEKNYLQCFKFVTEKMFIFNFNQKQKIILNILDVANEKIKERMFTIDFLNSILQNIKEPDDPNKYSKRNRNTAKIAAYQAARLNLLVHLKTIYENNYKFSKDKCKHICTVKKNHECLSWLLEIENKEYIEKLKTIIEAHKKEDKWYPVTCLNCAKHGYLEGIEYAVNNNLYFNYDRCLEIAKKFNNQDCVDYLDRLL